MMLFDLFFVCVLLVIASVMCGWAPLFVLSPSKRRWVSTLGVGALIGTAFVVVIPAGVHTMYLPPRIPPAQHMQQTPSPPPLPQPSMPLVDPVQQQPRAGDPATEAVDVDSDQPAAIGPWSRPIATVVGEDGSWQDGINKFKKPSSVGGQNRQAASPADPSHAHAEGAEDAHAHGHGRRILDASDTTTRVGAAATAATAAGGHSHDGHTHDFRRGSSSAPLDDRAVDEVAEALVRRSERLYAVATQSLSSATLTEPILVCFGEGHASSYMGASLALGFVAMLLMDRFFGAGSGGTAMHNSGREHAPETDVENNGNGNGNGSSKNSETGELLSRGKSLSAPPSSSGGGGGGVSEQGGGGGGSGRHGGSSTVASGSPMLGASLNLSTGTPRTRQTPTPGAATSSSHHLSFPSHAHHTTPSPSAGGSGGLGSNSSTSASGSSGGSGIPSRPQRIVGASSGPPSGLAHDANVLLGVFVHAVVAGITLGVLAVGSSSGSSSSGGSDSSSSSHTGWNVLPALLLHHAPSSFGVAAFLLYQGRSVKRVRSSVLLYACVAPAVALVTFVLLCWPGAAATSSGGTAAAAAVMDPLATSEGFAWLGLLSLFAGGAFLFTIAVHILPEIQAQNGGGHGHGSGPSPVGLRGVDAAHGHGGPGTDEGSAATTIASGSGGAGNAGINPASPLVLGGAAAMGSRMASPASRHEEASLLLGGGSSGPAAATMYAAEDTSHGMPWRHVWALILGLLMPLGASMLLPRNPIF
jgi:hypothetical protein